MYRIVICTLCVLVVSSAPALSDDKKPENEFKKLDGVWRVVSAELGGAKLPADQTKTWSLTLKGDRYVVAIGPTKDEGSVAIDISKMPHSMDIKGESGPNKGKTLLAIYELKGDKLIVCYDLNGKERPKEFKTAERTLQFLAEYKREKK